MRMPTWVMFLLLTGFFVLSPASAGEIRVLLSFDNAGHHVMQIVHADTATGVRLQLEQPLDESLGIASLIAALQPRVAILIWTDSQGRWQSSSTEPDPRVSHSPAHISSAAGSRIGEREGAWLVSGPDTASGLTILLPADPNLGLGFERWDVLLVDN